MRKFLIWLSLLIAALEAGVAIPSQDLSISSLGIEYSFGMRGQYITEQDIASHEIMNSLNFHYAPVPYLLFTAGLGLDKFTVDEYAGNRFEGNHGFAPSLGISLYTPSFFNDVVRVTGAFSVLYINSRHKPDFVYRGPVYTPSLGLIFTTCTILDLGIGAKGHIIYGTMGNTETDGLSSFSNRNKIRGYGQLTLHSPANGVYFSLEGDFSPEVSYKWENGPAEASISMAAGFILRKPRDSKERELDKYFPAYEDLKEKQDRMRMDQ